MKDDKKKSLSIRVVNTTLLMVYYLCYIVICALIIYSVFFMKDEYLWLIMIAVGLQFLVEYVYKLTNPIESEAKDDEREDYFKAD